VQVALLTAPLFLLDGALLSSNVAKYFISGPFTLSYPSETIVLLDPNGGTARRPPGPWDLHPNGGAPWAGAARAGPARSHGRKPE
jgi:hypothetical protein